MAKYVKLGEKASSFFDPFSRLTLAGKQEVVLLDAKALKSNRVKSALKGGHLSYASESEFAEFGGIVPEDTKEKTAKKDEDEDDDEKTIESKYGTNAEELLAYYKKTYEVSKTDIKKFKALSLQEMVDELKKLEE